jgi:hypothetical protein
MKKYILALFIATLGLGQAASITVGKGFGQGVNVLPTVGSDAITTFSFAIGTFAAEPAANASFADLVASFKEFGRTSTPLVNVGNTIIAVSSPFTAAPANAIDFNGKPIYILVGTDGLVNSTQYAVVKALNPAAGKWLFPANVAIADAGDAPMNSAANFQAVIGTRIDNVSGIDSLRLVGIPEPTSMVLLVGSLALGLRRRR